MSVSRTACNLDQSPSPFEIVRMRPSRSTVNNQKIRAVLLESVHDLLNAVNKFYKTVGSPLSSISKESFKAGDFIFFEGDIESHFYIIETGKVLIFTKDQDGKKIEIAQLSPGETLGEFALIDQGARTASAQAVIDTKLMKISSEGYKMMLHDLPVWASSMLTSFSNRLKIMNKTLKEKNKK